MAKLRCEIATPIKELYSGEATYVEIPGCEGGFGAVSYTHLTLPTN